MAIDKILIDQLLADYKIRDGWLSRQFDQVSKNVNDWPDWMKRAGGFEENVDDARETEKVRTKEGLGEKQSASIKPQIRAANSQQLNYYPPAWRVCFFLHADA